MADPTTYGTVSPERVGRCRVAAAFIHDLTCPTRHPHQWDKCRMGRWLFAPALMEALEYLDRNPRDAAGARCILHDAVCMSGCCGDDREDHAKRTQSKTVAALRKFRSAEL